MGNAAGMGTTTDGQDARSAAPHLFRPIGSPLPLGMVAPAGASVTLTAGQMGWPASGNRCDVRS